MRRGDWDAAWELALRVGTATELEELLTASIGDLLTHSRVATLERCVAILMDRVGPSGVAQLAQAEIALRHGEHLAAQAFAEQAADTLALDQKAYALCLAGSAAHVGSREIRALELFREAEELAIEAETLRRARWGYLVAATAIESAEALEVFRVLAAESNEPIAPEQAVRVADKRISLGMRFGSISTLDESRRTAELLPQVPDALVRCSFRSTYSCALNLAADYSRGFRGGLGSR